MLYDSVIRNVNRLHEIGELNWQDFDLWVKSETAFLVADSASEKVLSRVESKSEIFNKGVAPYNEVMVGIIFNFPENRSKCCSF